MENKAYVYMLTNDRGNVLYIGSTENLKERIVFHKKRLISGFTKKYNVTKLVYFEELSDLDEALLREKYLKGKNRRKKDKLIESMNPRFEDLTPPL
jgi:putative endonuclease